MRLTPLDIQQQQFRSGLWGFDPREVDAFLELVAAEVERLVRENHRLEDQLRARDDELDGHRRREETLKETMVTATRIAEDIRTNAHKEAELIVARAEARGEQIVENAHTRLSRVLEDLDELRRQRAQFEAGLRAVIETHKKLLDAMSERSTEPALLSALRRVEPERSGPELLTPRGGDR